MGGERRARRRRRERTLARRCRRRDEIAAPRRARGHEKTMGKAQRRPALLRAPGVAPAAGVALEARPVHLEKAFAPERPGARLLEGGARRRLEPGEVACARRALEPPRRRVVGEGVQEDEPTRREGRLDRGKTREA